MRKGIVSVSVIGLLLVAASAQAGTLYTDLPSFLAQVQPGYYLETFDGIGTGDLLVTTLGFSSGGYSYSASAPSGLWGLPVPGGLPTDVVLSTKTAYDALLFTFTSGNVSAVGGYFFPTDFNGNLIPGDIVLTLSDGTVHTLTNGIPLFFLGFTTDPGVWITSLSVDAVDTPDPLVSRWPTVNDLYVGTAIPEPTTGALLAGGVLLLAALARRRKKA